MSPLVIWLAMALWTVVALLVAGAARRGMGKGVAEFYIGGRRIGGFISGMTYAATTYSAFMLVGLVGLTYASGVGALGFEILYLQFTLLLLLVFGPRFWAAGRLFGLVTPPELLSRRYGGDGVAIIAALISLVMLIPYSAVQLIGAGLLVEGLSGGAISYIWGVLVMAGLAGVGAWWAGMRSVAWTDALQAVVMAVTSVAAIIAVMFIFFGSPAGFFAEVEQARGQLLSFTWPRQLFVGLTLPWAFFALTNPQVAQRLYVPRAARDLRRMMLYFAVFGLLYTVVSTLFGFSAALVVPGLENSDAAMPELLARIPAGLALILFVGIFAAASSTLGSIVLTLSSLFTRDVLRRTRPSVTEDTETSVARVMVLVVLAACIAFALLRPALIAQLSSAASGGLLVMAPAIIGTFFWRRGTRAGALWSMAVAAPITAFLYLSGIRPFGIWAGVWGAIVATVLFLGISLTSSAPTDTVDFMDSVEAELVKNGFLRRKAAGRTR